MSSSGNHPVHIVGQTLQTEQPIHNVGQNLQTVITTESADVAEEEIDSNGMSYFVDEDGRYYYHPVDQYQSIVPEIVEEVRPEPIHVDDNAQDGEPSTSEPHFQIVTLTPSENSNGELSYVLVVQEETQRPKIAVDIKEEKATIDVYNFEEEEEGVEEEEEEPQPEELTPAVTKAPKKKRKTKGPRSKFSCNFCNYTSHRRYLLVRHMKSHSEERPHNCTVCDRSFKTYSSLQNHTNMHKGIKPHVCKSCNASFTTSGELVRHVRYKHTHEKPHKCTECNYASVELSKLRRHVRCHTGERPYQCTDCTYASPDTFKLKRHQRTHTGEKPYKCDLCTMCFSQSNSLKAHRLIHNVSDKPVYACELCPAKCGRKTDLRIHVQKLHTSDKPLKCKRCGKSFPDRYSCKMHNKTHEGEKCFRCDLCPYASTTLRHLKSHILKHTDEKPFACEDCNQTFRQKQLLRRHQNLYHNPNYVPKPPKEKTHTCRECNRTFAHKGNLIRHLAIHDPESGHHERALALKLGRQKKVKYIDAETLKVLQDESQNQTQVLKIGMSELKRGELVTVNDCNGQQFVVLEVIQLEDGSERQVAVVAPDTVYARRNGGENMLIQVEDAVQPDDENMDLVTEELEMEVELEDDDHHDDDDDDDEEDMQTKMMKHRENQEKAAAERSIKLEKEVDACFGFEEEQDEDDGSDEFQESVIYQLV